MGTIALEGMEFYAYHGYFAEEQLIGNRFVVDLILDTDYSKAIESDQLEDTLNYQRVYELVKQEMAIPSKLLEHAAGRIVKQLYRHFPTITRVQVKLAKLNPPMGGQIERVSIILEQ